MENKTFYGLHTIPATIKVADGPSNLQSIAHSGGTPMTIAPQASTQDVGTRVLPVLYIQGSGPPVRVGAHVPVPSTSIGHQKITTRPVLYPASACCQASSVPPSPQITIVTTFTQPTLVQTYSQATLLPSGTPTLLSTCSQPTLLSTNTQPSSISKCSQSNPVPTCCQASFLPPTQSGLISTCTRPVFVSSVTRPTVIPSLVPSSAQFLPPLAPKPPIVSTNTSPSTAKTGSAPNPSPQLSTSKRIMIQTNQTSGTTSVKSPSYAYVGTLLRQEVKPGDSSQKILLANVPLPLSAPSGSASTTQPHKMASLLLPVTIPTQVNPGKTSVINLKIANRHILPDGKASVTVLRETPICPQPPPLQPISKPPKLVSISSGQVIQDKPFLPSKEQSQISPIATKKPNQEKQVESKKSPTSLLNDKRKKNRELSKCLKDAVDAIFYLKQPDASKLSPKKQKRKQKQKETAPDDVKCEPKVKEESDAVTENKSTVSTDMRNTKPNPGETDIQPKLETEVCPTFTQKEDKKEVKLVIEEPNLLNDVSKDNVLQSQTVAVDQNQSLQSKGETKSKTTNDGDNKEKSMSNSVKMHKTDIESELYSEDFDPIKILEWKDGIGTLPGSDLKFRLNEFNMMEIVDEDDYTMIMLSKKKREDCNASTSHERTISIDLGTNMCKYRKPTIECGTSVGVGKKADVCSKSTGTSDDIHCCINCGCYGLATEFYNTTFCSASCFKKKGTEMKKAQELRLHKLQTRRKRLKRLLNREKLQCEAEMKTSATSEEPRSREVGNDENRKSVDDVSQSRNKQIKKLPWQSSKGFLWTKYLDCCKAKAAPVKLFKDAFPYGKNGFKIGMKLEGIDPEHPAYFCVLTVADIQGYRLRLNFDGYSDMYDFWMNADSMDIFPVGWCEKNGHELHPPKNYKNPVFTWNSYLKQCKAQAAPRNLFSNKSGSTVCPSGFRLGMKLEAVDRKNSYLVCVATVADLMDNRILVHFDSWDDIYDYWADPSSPYIHPVGWCEQNGHILTPPLDYKPPESFSWEHYLKETKSQAAPARAFKQRPSCGFRPGMKLECVDRWVPQLIRVATVEDVSDHQIKIIFDGWSDVYSYWVDDDSPDIHPVGWCQKTSHDLEPPLTPADMEIVPDCMTRGCLGVGHVKGPKYSSHHSPATCPYAMENLQKDNLIADRLYGEKGEKVELPSPEPKQHQKTEVSPSHTQIPSTEVPRDDSSSKVIEEDTIARRLRKSYREKDHHSESESLPVKSESVSPVLRSMKTRKVEEKEDDPDWSLELEKPGGKRKSEKDESASEITPPKVRPEGKLAVRACKQRRVEVSEEKVPQADPNITKGDVRNNSGGKKSSTGNRSCYDRYEFYSPTKRCCREQLHFTLCNEVREAIVDPENEPEILHTDSYMAWAKHYEYLDFYTAHIDPDEFVNWSASEVAQFVSTIPGCEEKTYEFVEQEIDGEVFLLLSLVDLVRRIGLKLGPALKLYNCINMIRVRTVPRD